MKVFEWTCVVALVSIQLVNAWPDDTEHAFQKFITDFGRHYTAVEEIGRRQAFQKNYDFIQAENARGHSYTLGINQFSDMTPDEFRENHLSRPSNRTVFGGLPHLGTHQMSGLELPKSVDWQKHGAVTRVKSQEQCNVCWAFSATGAIEGAWQIATGNLVSLSEQQLMDCSSPAHCKGDGGWLDPTFSYVQTSGLCTEDSYGFVGKDTPCQASSCTVAVAPGQVTGYRDVAVNDESALMDAVAQQPVSVVLDAEDKGLFQNYQGGVIHGECGNVGDHAVLIVGYGTDAASGLDYWLVKNSWQVTWGEGGYARIQRGVTGSGECGIMQGPSYPTVSSSQETINV